jgi:tetratricopeptide (TPR) repeat protein
MIGAAAAVTAIGVHSFFDFNLHIPVNLFVVASLLGLTAAITGKQRPFLRLEARRPARPMVGALVLVLALVLAWLSVPLCLAPRRVQAGDDALAAGDWASAAAEYEKAIAMDKRFPLAQARLGDAHRRHHADPTAPLGPAQSRQLLAQAVQAYERALTLNPRDAGVWFRLAVVYEGQNQVSQARTAYDRALSLDPRNGPLLLRAGRLDAQYGMLVRGTERLEQAIRLGARGAREDLARVRAQKPPVSR